MNEKKCPGSDRWGRPAGVLGKGLCAECGQLVMCTTSGILFGHKAREENEK